MIFKFGKIELWRTFLVGVSIHPPFLFTPIYGMQENIYMVSQGKNVLPSKGCPLPTDYYISTEYATINRANIYSTEVRSPPYTSVCIMSIGRPCLLHGISKKKQKQNKTKTKTKTKQINLICNTYLEKSILFYFSLPFQFWWRSGTTTWTQDIFFCLWGRISCLFKFMWSCVVQLLSFF